MARKTEQQQWPFVKKRTYSLQHFQIGRGYIACRWSDMFVLRVEIADLRTAQHKGQCGWDFRDSLHWVKGNECASRGKISSSARWE